MHDLLSFDLTNQAHADGLGEIFELCQTLSTHLLVSYMPRVLDICFYSISDIAPAAEPAFRLAVKIFDAFPRPGDNQHRGCLDKYVQSAYRGQAIHLFLLSHVDTVLLWMDYPTMAPNRNLTEVLRVCISHSFSNRTSNCACKYTRLSCDVFPNLLS